MASTTSSDFGLHGAPQLPAVSKILQRIQVLQTFAKNLRSTECNTHESIKRRKRGVLIAMHFLEQYQTELHRLLLLDVHHTSSAGDEILRKCQASLSKLGFETSQVDKPSQTQFKSRESCIKEELDDVESLQNEMFSASACSVAKSVITHLRSKEQSIELHASILREATNLTLSRNGDANQLSVDNFAYGSTPFRTWLLLFQELNNISCCKVVLDELRAMHSENRYIVFGSSIGWLVFYGNILGLRNCVGVEIMSCLHDIAVETNAEQQATGNNGMYFLNCDMLQAELVKVNPGIIVLASQCWDNELQMLTYEKLSKELPSASLVIDYSDKLSCTPFQGRFKLVHQTRLPVSWNEKQHFHVWQKQ